VTGGHRFTTLTAGSEYTCGLDADGAVWCWGTNNLGQVGTGDSTDALAPARVPLAVRALTIGAGQNHTCVTALGSRIFCWGQGREGQLGQGSRADSREPLEAGVDRGGR
jgi:alpha-tubulin suppressor-like RCC1 family protein